MNITDEQIKQIYNFISLFDIKSYIEQHHEEYEIFLKEETEKTRLDT